MLQPIVRCRAGDSRAGKSAVDLTGRDDHIAQPLTIQIASHMNHHPVGQFDPQAAAVARRGAVRIIGTRRGLSQGYGHKLR